jgi:site-specific recombinase XerD
MHGALRILVQMLVPGREISEEDVYMFPWEQLRYAHTSAIRTHLVDLVTKVDPTTNKSRYTAASANKFIRALRGVLKSAWRHEMMTTDEYQRAVDIQDIRGKTVSKKGRSFKEGELELLLQACRRHPTVKGCRDLAIIFTLWATGMRRKEIVKLDIADYDREEHSLFVRGKNNSERIVYIEATVAYEALHDWLTARGSEAGPLFLRIRRGGHIVRAKSITDQESADQEDVEYENALEQQNEDGLEEHEEEGSPDGRLTDQAIYFIVTSLGRENGIWDIAPHGFRRNFISEILNNTGDLSVASNLAGHSKTDTTRLYDKRGEKAKKKAAGTLKAPSVRWKPPM